MQFVIFLVVNFNELFSGLYLIDVPRDLNKVCIVVISERFGTFVNSKVSGDNIERGIRVKHAFFAPEILTSPLNCL